MPPKIEETY